MKNNLKTFALLAGLSALFILIGALLGGKLGLIIAVLLAGAMNLGAYWYSDRLVLRLYRAQLVTSLDHDWFYRLVQNLARRANLPMPKVYLIESEAPNAFATGRSPEHASVAATTGLLDQLTQEEITGVMAHELSHVLHRDTLISAVTATLAGAISGVANWFLWLSVFGGHEEGETNPVVGLLLMLLAPLAASLIQLAISRSREFEADREAGVLTGHPEWLASALQKLEQCQEQSLDTAETHPATAHLFIVNPLRGEKLATLFSTHPLTQERIKRLLRLKEQLAHAT